MRQNKLLSLYINMNIGKCFTYSSFRLTLSSFASGRRLFSSSMCTIIGSWLPGNSPMMICIYFNFIGYLYLYCVPIPCDHHFMDHHYLEFFYPHCDVHLLRRCHSWLLILVEGWSCCPIINLFFFLFNCLALFDTNANYSIYHRPYWFFLLVCLNTFSYLL